MDDECIAMINAQQDLLVRMKEIRPYINRAIAMSECHGVNNRIRDIIRLKLPLNQLPDVEALKSMPDVFIRLLYDHARG